MIPIVSHVNELKWLRPRLRAVASKTREALGIYVTYLFGTMIEVPRAALTADEVATEAEFFSFGSNDLTQMTFAFSRDDAESKFLNHYVETEILPHNPVQHDRYQWRGKTDADGDRSCARGRSGLSDRHMRRAWGATLEAWRSATSWG